MQTGDLVSSFGGGGPMWYLDDAGQAALELQIVILKHMLKQCIIGMKMVG